MGWENQIKSRIKTGATYRMSSIGKVKVVGHLNQFGGNNSGGAIFVKCEIVESAHPNYPVGSFHELNAEFMY